MVMKKKVTRKKAPQKGTTKRAPQTNVSFLLSRLLEQNPCHSGLKEALLYFKEKRAVRVPAEASQRFWNDVENLDDINREERIQRIRQVSRQVRFSIPPRTLKKALSENGIFSEYAAQLLSVKGEKIFRALAIKKMLPRLIREKKDEIDNEIASLKERIEELEQQLDPKEIADEFELRDELYDNPSDLSGPLVQAMQQTLS